MVIPAIAKTKKSLLAHVDKNLTKTYAINEMAKSWECEIVRLPTYFCIFNPTELIWGVSQTKYSETQHILKVPRL